MTLETLTINLMQDPWGCLVSRKCETLIATVLRRRLMLHEKKKKTHLVCYMNLIIIINKVEKNEGAIKTTKRCVCL